MRKAEIHQMVATGLLFYALLPFHVNQEVSTMKITVPIVNAFVDGNHGGNPAGVVLNAQSYTHAERLKISAAVGLSETAFVSPSTIADFKLDFYTPTMQIAHCGHATIATFGLLSQQGYLTKAHTSKETIDGKRDIIMTAEMAYMEQVAPQYTELDEHDLVKVYESLGGANLAPASNGTPLIVDTGNAFLLHEFNSKDVLTSIKPNLDLITQISEAHNLIGYYVFSRDTFKEDSDACARMFAPRYGITEESATGMAAGPLACYLYDKLRMAKEVFAIEQGYLMVPPSPSAITVRLELTNGSITRLMAGGKAVVSEYRDIVI